MYYVYIEKAGMYMYIWHAGCTEASRSAAPMDMWQALQASPAKIITNNFQKNMGVAAAFGFCFCHQFART